MVNAKVSRPSVCNAMDTIIIDKPIAERFLKELQPLFEKYGVEIFADEISYSLLKDYAFLYKVGPGDFGKEFLSLKCAVKVVRDIDDALVHIQQYSTKHSEAIVSENRKNCERYLQEVDAAAVAVAG